ncbi:hypothetical protein [Aurantimonas endophytica]|uniref:Uncharacterized protein (DUF2336 family) n=1 Tax=Aurantimonas endophytica TaxID=1522175 RepID=A0A7W6MQN7_9HYPH|nr:hypothetical protein [Aurantimonas endophytica]MBB4004190.1 uncharacterized protein (DUF2336 family) [Aurantimonas endophytica]MCO6405033.1 hypothetical protein [Aurantimonas endophytica]
MKDEAPRIFRSLEKEAGRGGFDTVVRAAVASYAALRSPSEHQARSLGRLLVPVWGKLTLETQSGIAFTLAAAPSLPRAVVECLLAAPAPIAEPFLRASRCLTAEDIATLAGSPDPLLRQIAAARGDAQPAAETRPREPRVETAPLAAVSAMAPRAAAAPLPAAIPASAAEARATLRMLVQPGAAPRTSTTPGTVKEIIAAARAGEIGRAYRGLAQLLDLGPETMTELVAEPEGDMLASALKAMRIGSGDALTIIMLLKPRIGLDVHAFQAMKGRYRDLDADICRMRLRMAAPRPMRTASPALQPRAAELEPRLRTAAPRAAFGRRRSAPTATATSGTR